jgi:hypothetical protein
MGREYEDGYSGSGVWLYGVDRADSGYLQVIRCCNKPSGSLKCGIFLD